MSTSVTPRTAEVVIYQGDDLARIAELRRAVEVAGANIGPARIGDTSPSPAQAAAQEYDDFVTEAAERAVLVTLRQLPRKEWRELRAKHPPRKDNEDDAAAGFNIETLGDDLVPAAIVSPEFPSRADRDEFLDSLADADFERLMLTAHALNTQPVADPKAQPSLRSVVDRMSAEN